MIVLKPNISAYKCARYCSKYFACCLILITTLRGVYRNNTNYDFMIKFEARSEIVHQKLSQALWYVTKIWYVLSTMVCYPLLCNKFPLNLVLGQIRLSISQFYNGWKSVGSWTGGWGWRSVMRLQSSGQLRLLSSDGSAEGQLPGWFTHKAFVTGLHRLSSVGHSCWPYGPPQKAAWDMPADFPCSK